MLRYPISPTGAGSKVGLEVMLIDSVTLSDGYDPGERALTRHHRRRPRRARSQARTNDLEVTQDDGHTRPRGRPPAKNRC